MSSESTSDTDLSPLWSAIDDRWRAENVKPHPVASAVEIAAFESRYGLPLPRELRDYFLILNGTGDDLELEGFRFWPLRDVLPVSEELAYSNPQRTRCPDCYVFADYMLWCWGYAVRIVPGSDCAGPVLKITGSKEPPETIAPTFVDFLRMYLHDRKSVIY